MRLRPVSSAYLAQGCGGSNKGRSCAEAFGTDLQANLALNLNLYFGDEALYSSRYQQSAPGAAYDSNKDNGVICNVSFPFFFKGQ